MLQKKKRNKIYMTFYNIVYGSCYVRFRVSEVATGSLASRRDEEIIGMNLIARFVGSCRVAIFSCLLVFRAAQHATVFITKMSNGASGLQMCK